MAGALIDPGPSTIIRSILDMYGIDWLYFIIVVVSSLQLIAGIVMIVTLACHYFFSCRGKRLLTTVSVISVAFNILYAILGIICFSIFVNSSIADIITDMYGISQSAAESLYGDLDFTTVCWIPALITALLFLSYCIAILSFRTILFFFTARAIIFRPLRAARVRTRNTIIRPTLVPIRRRRLRTAPMSARTKKYDCLQNIKNCWTAEQ